MFDKIIQLDYTLFFLINQYLANPFFDLILPLCRAPWFWAPLYLFVILFVFQKFPLRQALIWLLFFVLIVALCDSISSHIIKQLIYRMRPCFDPLWHGKVRHLTSYCSSSSSFTSSHASNHFGMALFLFYSLKNHSKKYAYLFYVWAFIIIYAQVYVGVHYPLDVFCGALLGTTIAYLSLRQYKKILSSYHTLPPSF